VRALSLFIISLFLLTIAGQGAEPAPLHRAVVIAATGSVEFRLAGGSTWYPVATNHVLNPGDALRTAPRSRAMLLLEDRSVLPVRESSVLELLPRDQGVLARLVRGVLSFFHRDEPGRIEVESGGIHASVRGTDFVFEAEGDGRIRLVLYDGEVELVDAAGNRETLVSGDIATAGPGQPPRKTAALTAGDWSAVQWVLHYPAILDPAEVPWDEPRPAAIELSWQRYLEGDLPGALAAYPDDRLPSSPAERLFLAALLLSVGSVAEAEGWLAEATHDPGIAELAAAHQRLIEIIRRGPQFPLPAGENIREELTATSLMAESYDLQAAERLSDARARSRDAVQRSPGFGFAWVRLAELEFMHGRVREAGQAVEHGLELTPANAQGHVLRGFLLASRHRVSEAVAAFEQALALDPGLGNAWLGRGLCKIRRGDLEGGRMDLLIAAATEPQRALLRSYLGKAFADWEWFRVPTLESKARHEWDLARRIDPRDPTPSLYSALLNQSENRVNEAVTDLEQSIVLNDHRALYRSRLALDQDRAVRGANLAAIYQDAGMPIFGVREATRAVESDYASFSSHQFLADSYNALRDPDQVTLRYESAWFSEYLVANLLAPVGAGRLSTTLAPNEYSRLFERDRPGLAGRTDYWSNGDWQQTASHFGHFGSFGYAIDVFYRSELGQRINDDSEQLALSLQAKQQLGPRDSLFFQTFYYDAEFGDVAAYYDPASANPGLRAIDRQEPQVLAGWHRAWTPGSDSLFLLARMHDRYSLSDPLLPQRVNFLNPDGSIFASGTAITPWSYLSEFTAWSIEGQHIWTSEPHTLIAGLRYQTGTFDTESELGPGRALGTALPGLIQDEETDLGRFSAYAYQHWDLFEWLRLSAGLTYDWLEQPLNYRVPPIAAGEDSTDRLSPKAGITARPWTGAVLRAAYTRSLGGVSFDQSFRLEPTQVAGFNQTFRGLIPESVAGSVAGQEFETWGASLEQRLGTGTYLTVGVERLGSEAARILGTREVTLSGLTSGGESQVLDFEERTALVTLNQLVGRDLAFGATYRLSKATLDDAFEGSPFRETESVLHQLELQARLNHPSGFFALAEAIWTRQSNHGYSPDRPGDDFWHLNALAGWRFHHRALELSAGFLNLTDADYRLNPLNAYRQPYRDRTFTMSLRFDF
jgi:tetratricopeptide (TPR) repeat protein